MMDEPRKDPESAIVTHPYDLGLDGPSRADRDFLGQFCSNRKVRFGNDWGIRRTA